MDVHFSDPCEQNQEQGSKQQVATVISSFQMTSGSNEKKEADFVRMKKKFRQQRRKDYLSEYFSKKRAEYFGWSHEEYLKSRKQTVEINHDVQIDRPIPVFPEKLLTDDLSSKYNSNYFKNVVLLQRLLAENQEIELDTDSFPNSYNFTYKSLYAFVIDVIRESLDKSFFQKFEDEQVFANRFTSLKDSIYKKLGEEIENFLVAFYGLGSNLYKQQSNPIESPEQTYCKLLVQLENFLFIQNLETEQEKEWPLITISEQLCFLLKIFIEITYYDLPVQAQNFFDRMASRSSKVQEKYREVFENCDDQIEQRNTSVTLHLVNETILLERLKFLIVFGHSEVNRQEQDEGQTEKRRKSREIRLIIHLLGNIAFNIGSEVLFQRGIIKELKFILNEPYFKVNIGRRKRNHLNEIHIPEMYLRIQAFLIDAFEMIRSEKGLEYMSEMDSLSFVFETLLKVTQIKRQIQYLSQLEDLPIKLDNQVILIDLSKEDEISQTNGYESDEEIQEDMRLKNSNFSLMQLAQKCISSIEFHLAIGELLFENESQYQGMKVENRYRVKLRCIIELSQGNVLEEYQKGRELLKRWKITQN